jgi:hypothetical protein
MRRGISKLNGERSNQSTGTLFEFQERAAGLTVIRIGNSKAIAARRLNSEVVVLKFAKLIIPYYKVATQLKPDQLIFLINPDFS